MTRAEILEFIVLAFAERDDDTGDYDTTTALSYRELGAMAEPNAILIETWNSGFQGEGNLVHRRDTSDGVTVRWFEWRGVPTGADWLPERFVSWMLARASLQP